MPVQPPQKGLFPVEEEAVVSELHHPEAHLLLLHVHNSADFQQGHPAGVEDGVLRVPGLDAVALNGDDAVGGEGLANQHPFPLQQLHQQQAPVGVMEGGADFQRGQGRRGNKQANKMMYSISKHTSWEVVL